MFRRSGKVWSPISASACYGAATVGPAKAAQFARGNDEKSMLVAGSGRGCRHGKEPDWGAKKGAPVQWFGAWTGALGSPLAPGGKGILREGEAESGSLQLDITWY